LGITRHPVECPGCQAPILLRLGVGHESRQRFYYVCPKCKAATKGALLWHGGARTELELADGGRLDTDEKCVAALSINPELPSFPETKSMAEFGGSPWINPHSMAWTGWDSTVSEIFLSDAAVGRHGLGQARSIDHVLLKSRLASLRSIHRGSHASRGPGLQRGVGSG
jgi:hypothetical protein